MDPGHDSGAGPSIPPSRLEGPSKNDTGTAGKKRPVRRDPEKRRQQNIQAQKKYSESSPHSSSVMLHVTTTSGLVPR